MEIEIICEYLWVFLDILIIKKFNVQIYVGIFVYDIELKKLQKNKIWYVVIVK